MERVLIGLQREKYIFLIFKCPSVRYYFKKIVVTFWTDFGFRRHFLYVIQTRKMVFVVIRQHLEVKSLSVKNKTESFFKKYENG